MAGLPPPLKDPSIGFILQKWLNDLRNFVLSKPVVIPAYATADLPAAADHGDGSTFSSLVYVTDAAWVSGGVGYSQDADEGTLAFSDGSNWKRLTDNAVIA